MRIASLDAAAVTPAQASAWHNLISAAHDADFPGEPALTRTQTMGEFVSGNHERRIWCAWSGDELVGAIILVTWARVNPTFAEALGWVRPDHRRRGIGRGLVERAIDEAVNLGRREITLYEREKTPPRRSWSRSDSPPHAATFAAFCTSTTPTGRRSPAGPTAKPHAPRDTTWCGGPTAAPTNTSSRTHAYWTA